MIIAVSLRAQNVYVQNFDSSLTLPANWLSTPSGWEVDTSNSSSGYTGASGLNNVVIKNLNPTGVYELRTTAFPTTGFKDITVSWGARHTVNFPTSGSTIQSFDFSVDNGVTWTNVPFTQNASNSIWALINHANSIPLPSGANDQPSVMLRWVANIINSTAGGTYRIDDLSVSGQVLASVSTTLPEDIGYWMSTDRTLQLRTPRKTGLTVQLFGILGDLVYSQTFSSWPTSVELPETVPGNFLLLLTDKGTNETFSIKIKQ